MQLSPSPLSNEDSVPPSRAPSASPTTYPASAGGSEYAPDNTATKRDGGAAQLAPQRRLQRLNFAAAAQRAVAKEGLAAVPAAARFVWSRAVPIPRVSCSPRLADAVKQSRALVGRPLAFTRDCVEIHQQSSVAVLLCGRSNDGRILAADGLHELIHAEPAGIARRERVTTPFPVFTVNGVPEVAHGSTALVYPDTSSPRVAQCLGLLFASAAVFYNFDLNSDGGRATQASYSADDAEAAARCLERAADSCVNGLDTQYRIFPNQARQRLSCLGLADSLRNVHAKAVKAKRIGESAADKRIAGGAAASISGSDGTSSGAPRTSARDRQGPCPRLPPPP
jgi:hypothetical protein